MSRVVKAYNVNMTQDVLQIKGLYPVEVIEKPNHVDVELTKNQVLEEISKLQQTANLEAELIINNALAEAARIKDQAYREIEVQKTRIYEQSKISGYNEGQNLSQIELEKKLAEIEDVKQQAIIEKHNTLKEIEPHMVSILKDLTSKIVGNYIKYNDEFILYLVKSGLEDVKENKIIKVRINDCHKEVIEENNNFFLTGFSRETNIEFIYASEMDIADCIIETPSGNIDLSVDSQLEKIKEYLDLLLNEK